MKILRPALVPLAVAALLAAVPASAQQQTVYEWKDAKGVTHYTDMPPSNAHKVREIRRQSSVATEAKPAVETSNPQCLDARSNLLKLKSGQDIGIDSDNDGKADRNLTAQERASQTTLNEAAVKAYCG